MGAQIQNVGTVAAMYGYPLATGNKTDDGIVGHGVAAVGHLRQQTAHPVDLDIVRLRGTPMQSRFIFSDLPFRLLQGDDARRQFTVTDFIATHSNVERISLLHAAALCQYRVREFFGIHAFEFALDDLSAILEVHFLIAYIEPGADFGACATSV